MSLLPFVTQGQKEQCDFIEQTSRHETIQWTVSGVLKTVEKSSVRAEKLFSCNLDLSKACYDLSNHRIIIYF